MLGDLIAGYNELVTDVQKYITNYEYLIYDLTLFNEIKGEIKLRIFLMF